MKRIFVGLLAVCLLGSLTVLAEEQAVTEKATTEKATTEKAAPAKAVKKAAPVALQDLTVTGTLEQDAKKAFSIKEADGTVVKVATPKAGKTDAAAAIDLAQYVGKNVKVVGKGIAKTGKDGKKTTAIRTVTSIEEVPATK